MAYLPSTLISWDGGKSQTNSPRRNEGVSWRGVAALWLVCKLADVYELIRMCGEIDRDVV